MDILVFFKESSRSSYYGWVVVGMTFLAEFLAFGLAYCFGVFIKPLVSEFHWSRTATTGAFSIYGISHVVFAVATGRITDKFGPRVIAAIGGFCICLAMFLMSRISAIWEVYLFYGIIFSFGVASIYSPLLATVSRWLTEKRGLGVGIAVAGTGASSLVFSPLAGWLISSYGWRMAYIIVGFGCLVLFIPVVLFLRQPPRTNIEKDSPRESTSKDFSAVEALKSRAFWMIAFSWLFGATAYWAIIINVVPLLRDMGVSLVVAGTVAGIIGGMSIVGKVGGGFLSDIIGRKQCLIVGFVVQLGGLILLLFWQELWIFFLFAIIFGLGIGVWAGVIPSFPRDFFGPKATATILGLILMFGGVGVALGPIAGAYIFDVTGSYYHMIWLGLAVSLLAIVFGYLIRDPAK